MLANIHKHFNYFHSQQIRIHKYVAGLLSYFGKIPMNIASLLFENSDRIIVILNLNNSASNVLQYVVKYDFTKCSLVLKVWLCNFYIKFSPSVTG